MNQIASTPLTKAVAEELRKMIKQQRLSSWDFDVASPRSDNILGDRVLLLQMGGVGIRITVEFFDVNDTH